MPAEVEMFGDISNYIFTGINALEAGIKLLGLGKVYFKEGWNIFDFTIALLSLISLTNFTLNGSTTIVRSFRILRILRLTKRALFLKLIFNTFILSLPAIANVGSLFLLFLYIYSIIGMQFFAGVRHTGVMNDVVNFKHFGNSFLTLFIVATGDSWNQIMNSFL
jgi:voltage-gated sodium channel